MTAIIYGIANCDTIKKARAWLRDHDIDAEFHDYKKAGISEAKLKSWADEIGWEKLLNRAGTTFRKLPDEDKQELDAAKAIAIMMANPSAIKRPILETDGTVTAGFKPDLYAGIFGN